MFWYMSELRVVFNPMTYRMMFRRLRFAFRNSVQLPDHLRVPLHQLLMEQPFKPPQMTELESRILVSLGYAEQPVDYTYEPIVLVSRSMKAAEAAYRARNSALSSDAIGSSNSQAEGAIIAAKRERRIAISKQAEEIQLHKVEGKPSPVTPYIKHEREHIPRHRETSKDRIRVLLEQQLAGNVEVEVDPEPITRANGAYITVEEWRKWLAWRARNLNSSNIDLGKQVSTQFLVNLEEEENYDGFY